MSKRLWNYKIVVCILFTVLSFSALQASNLQTILVGDTEATDLLPGLKFDLKNIGSETKKIASYTGLKLKETVLSGKNARTSIVLSKLKNLQVQSNDTIIFYFTGHGYRTPSKGDSPWPNLFFYYEDKGIDVNDVIDILSAKNARLVIIITDCCNNFLADEIAPPLVKERVLELKASSTVKKNYQKLFLQTHGVIVMSSSEIGQTSLCINKGSLFTLAFLESLKKETKKPTSTVSWQSVLDLTNYTTSTKAEKIGEEQNPIFLIQP